MEQNEVELIDYLKVIWKRKYLIVGGTLVAAATALIVSISAPKTYEVSRTLKVGKLPGSVSVGLVIGGKFIEAREDVIAHLKDQRALRSIMEKLHSGLTELSSKEISSTLVSIDSKANPDLRFTVRANDPHVSTQIADQLAQYIIKTHGQIFERAMQIVKGYEAETAIKIRSLEAEIRSLKGVAGRMTKTSDIDPTMIALLQASIGDRERNLVGLRREMKDTRLSQLGSENTSVIAADAPPQHPAKPRVKLNVMLAGTLGLMMFTFVAFFMEYIEKAKGRGK